MSNLMTITLKGRWYLVEVGDERVCILNNEAALAFHLSRVIGLTQLGTVAILHHLAMNPEPLVIDLSCTERHAS